MPKLSIKEIQKRAIAIITESPGGIRYSPLHAKIKDESPETPGNTINGAIWNLQEVMPKLVISRVAVCSSQPVALATTV